MPALPIGRHTCRHGTSSPSLPKVCHLDLAQFRPEEADTNADVRSGKYVLTDLKGAQGETVLNHIIETPAQRSFLVTPLHALNDIPEELRGCLELQKQFFPHLDLDHIDDAMTLGWKDGMTLGVFIADRACLRPGLAR